MGRLLRPVGLIVVAAIVGFALARSAGSGTRHRTEALSRTGSTTAFSVRYPSDWGTTDPAPLPGLALSDRLAIAPSASATERLVIGAARAATVGTLPAAFLDSLSTRPRPQVVALGDYRLDRYLDLRPRGAVGAVSVYLLATTRSTIVATCETRAPASAFVGECERVLATLRLPTGTIPSAAVDAAYALGLNGILAALDRVRRAAGPGLLASDLATRARAADRLAAAETSAALAAGRLSTGSATTANRALVGALRRAAGGYRALAGAARRRDPTGYRAAQTTLAQAQATLTTAFKTLAALGYRLR